VTACPDSSFAARIGGEEFLLVMSGIGPADAVERLENLRRTVADHCWRAMTAHHPVTISLGVTTYRPGGDQPSLLAQADVCLYTAKREGRNRVCTDFAVPLPERRTMRADGT
jgi:diguanylate cyclase (GGDEF)-like protein